MLKVNPKVSVIVCHHKGDFIHKFVESVKQSSGVTYEIIVVSSDDGLCETGIDGCIVVNGPPLPAAKRNTGARLARGYYLAFFDDDVEIDKDCLETLCKCLESDAFVGMAYGKLYNMERRNRLDEAGSFLTSTGFLWSRAAQNVIDEGQFDEPCKVLAGKSASCMIPVWAFRIVDGFDEDFGILGEETDLSWRVWLHGYHVIFEPNAVGYHAFNTSLKPAKLYYTSSRVHYNGCRNYITMLIKNLSGRNLACILPLHVAIWAIAGLLMCVTGKFAASFNIFRGLLYPLLNLRSILEKRRKVQSRRVKSDGELWPHIFSRPPRGYYSKRIFRYVRIGLHG